MRADVRRLLRSIPPVDELLAEDEGVALVARYSHASVRDALVIVLDRYRESIKSGETEVSFGDVEPGVIWTRVCDVLQEWFDPGPQKVINATGVVLHTNLGRAPLSAEAIRRLGVVGASYSDLEYDLKAGKRGSRGHFAVEALRRLTGAEDALVVNNNAAALLLILNTFAPGHGVVVSRGELVEIGGSFRIPEVLRAGGAHLVEVGTTNRTHPSDYRNAITEGVTMLMKVHRSNFHLEGFTAEVSAGDIADMARRGGLLSVYDLGSGYLGRKGVPRLAGEPSVVDAVSSGVDLVTFSGDKLLGGPQAGIILGSQELLHELRTNHLLRALRVDKITLSALGATLSAYLNEREREEIPVLRMIGRDQEELENRARGLADQLAEVFPGRVEVVAGSSRVGGGSSPGLELPTHLVRCTPRTSDVTAWIERLRGGEPPVILRVASGSLLLDPRTLLAGDESAVLGNFICAANSIGGDARVR